MRNRMRCMACALCLLCLWSSAMAQPLDFSGVVEKAGRLTGEIDTGIPLNDDPNNDTTVYLDCAAPVPLTDEQWMCLKTEFWQIDKKTFTKALAEIGCDTKKGKVSRSMSDPLHRGISYKQERDIDAYGCMEISPEAAQQAISKAEELFSQLGLTIGIASVLDYGERSWAACGYREDGTLLPNNEADWLPKFMAKEAERNRDPSDYLWLSGSPLLRGLPVGSMSYPDGDRRDPSARCGIASGVSVFADKSGHLLNVYLEGIPIEMSAEPLFGKQPNWKAAFERLNEQWAFEGQSWFNALRTDCPLEDGLGTISYATRNVLTAITPMWVGISKNELVPGYCFTVETRRKADDVCIRSWDGYIDMVEMTAVQSQPPVKRVVCTKAKSLMIPASV